MCFSVTICVQPPSKNNLIAFSNASDSISNCQEFDKLNLLFSARTLADCQQNATTNAEKRLGFSQCQTRMLNPHNVHAIGLNVTGSSFQNIIRLFI